MKAGFLQWLSERSKQMVNSIAFYPALIAFAFLCTSILMVVFDYSETGKAIKASWHLLRLRDASTARSIISAIAAGLISLTVFSFSMVMIVLNQAASQMSNRVLDKLIGNRFQQIVLGFYIGTIVCALFLLSTIRDIDDGIYVPSLSTYLLILLTIADIFLFIYFLHYITQSVKYEVVIDRIHRQTKKALLHTCPLHAASGDIPSAEGQAVPSPESGIFTGLNREGLLAVATTANIRLTVLPTLGSFILKGTPLLLVFPAEALGKDGLTEDILRHVLLRKEEGIDNDFTYGFRQLKEVAIKALSPGINDPGTAVASLRALADLLALRLQHHPSNVSRDEDGEVRVVTTDRSFADLFCQVLLPIWDYGKNDRMVQDEMASLLRQLRHTGSEAAIAKLQAVVQARIRGNDET